MTLLRRLDNLFQMGELLHRDPEHPDLPALRLPGEVHCGEGTGGSKEDGG